MYADDRPTGSKGRPRRLPQWRADLPDNWCDTLVHRLGVSDHVFAWAFGVNVTTALRWRQNFVIPGALYAALGVQLLKLPRSTLFDLGQQLNILYEACTPNKPDDVTAGLFLIQTAIQPV